MLGNDRIPHQNWNAVLGFLRELGYRDARVYKICFGRNHVNLIEDHECCSDCGKKWKDGVSYYVLGFNFKDTFISNEFLLAHMAHWRAKEEWFNKHEQSYNRKEIWHGTRFQELSYSWDQNKETLLPALCPLCSSVFPAQFVSDQSCDGIMSSRVTCHSCYSEVEIFPKVMVGCPLNQAYIIHEDGFNAFTKKTRSIASIQIASACKLKEDRLHSDMMFKCIALFPLVMLKVGLHIKWMHSLFL